MTCRPVGQFGQGMRASFGIDHANTADGCMHRFLQRITPVTNTTHADPNSLKRLAYRILQPLIAPTGYTLEQRDSDEPIKVNTSSRHAAKLCLC